MPTNLKDKTVVQLRQLCKKKNIRLTKQDGGYRTKSSLLRSLHSKNKKQRGGDDPFKIISEDGHIYELFDGSEIIINPHGNITNKIQFRDIKITEDKVQYEHWVYIDGKWIHNENNNKNNNTNVHFYKENKANFINVFSKIHSKNIVVKPPTKG